MLARVGIQLSPHFSHWDNSFRGSIKFFHLKIALGLALGKSWPLLAQGQKNTHVHKGMLLWENFPKQTCKNYLRRNKDLNSWIKFRLYNNSFAPALGGACAMGTKRLSFSAQLQTAMLAHVGA